jgi:excisionase family DNA binding protein
MRNARRISKKPKYTGVSASEAGWSLQRAAAYSGIGYDALRRLAKSRQIPGVFIGNRFIVSKRAFIAWFESRMPGAAA